MSLFFSAFDCMNKIDCLLAKYYIAMGRNDYFNNDKIGKFESFCDKHGGPDSVINEISKHEESDYESDESQSWLKFDVNFLNIDHEFPTTSEDKNDEVMTILKYFYGIAANTSHIKQQLSWANISNIISFEFDEKICESFRKILDEHKIDNLIVPKHDEIETQMTQLQQRRNLPQDQYVWLLYVITKHMFDINIDKVQSIDVFDEMHDVYSVHKIFMNDNKKTSDYNFKHFANDLKQANDVNYEISIDW
eukprot:373984_1